MTTLELPVARPAAKALLVAARPKQWVKNVLVFAAPLAAGALTQRHVLGAAGVAFVAFTCASAACYLINDVYDIDRDRLHPHKRNRPLAAGELSIGVAVTSAVILLLAAVLITLPLEQEIATAILLGYVATVVVYGVKLKEVPGVELLMIALGFVLRALAGAAATGVPPSPWFLLVCCFAALTIATGKRQVELACLASNASAHRTSLASYSRRWLRRARSVSAAGAVAAYALWALARPTGHDRLFGLISLLPIVAALVRLGRLNDAGVGDAPEVVLLTDRWLQAACVAWIVLFVVGLGRM